MYNIKPEKEATMKKKQGWSQSVVAAFHYY
jgi:hypothetical protein